MQTGRQPFFSSLAFKVGIIIVLAEMVILGITGTFYIYNFNTEINRQIASNVLRPAALMNQGLLKLDVVTNAGYMHELVGEELINTFVIGVNGNIFYSMNKAYTGQSADSVSLIDSSLLSPNLTHPLVRQRRPLGRIVALTPLFGVDGRSLRFFVYIEASTAVTAEQKRDIVWLFVFGSLAVVGLTSVAILVGFNRTIFSPLQEILSALRQAKAGELPKRLSLADTRDELGELARAFNRMAVRLQQTLETLHRERDLLQRITETSPVGITVVDRNGQVTFANAQSEKVLGLSKDSITQRTYNAPSWRITDMEGNPFPDEALPFRRVMSTRRPVYDVRHAIVWPDGRSILLSINAAPLLDGANEVNSVICTIEDITARVAAEERFHLVFKHSPVSIWEEDFSAIKTLFDDFKKQGVTDIEAWFDQHPGMVRQCAESVKIVDVNRAALALHGAASKEELLGGLVQTFTPESFDIFRRELVCLWHGKTEMRTDAVVKTLAGERRDVTVYFSVCPGREQTLDKLLVSLVDITERKRAVEALSDSEEELRTLIKAMTDVVVVNSSEGRYLKIVDTSPSLLYRPPKELLGKTLHQVFPKDRADFFLSHIRQALHTGKSVNFEYSLHISGRQIWFNATVSPMAANQILMVARDITDRKTAEEALHKLNLELDQRIVERTAQLEATNKELEAFAYSVSHDLRAPLRHIDGFLELLEKDVGAVLDERGRHYMDTISEAAHKMGALIDDLLAFSRMGRHTMAFKPVELGILVNNVIGELEPDIADREILWQIGDFPEVRGDAAMLRIVLTNLIANAVKFTQPREKAHIEIGSQPGQNADTVIYVRDNGVGFDMAYADRLFRVFQRLHRTEEFEGTGIGLANVHRIIARHGGRTWAEGELDHGATFFFSLPQIGAK